MSGFARAAARELFRYALAFLTALALASGAGIAAASWALLGPAAYARAADDPRVLAGVEASMAELSAEAAAASRLPEDLIADHLPAGDELADFVEASLADLPGILAGAAEGYRAAPSFDGFSEDALAYAREVRGEEPAPAERVAIEAAVAEVERAGTAAVRVLDVSALAGASRAGGALPAPLDATAAAASALLLLAGIVFLALLARAVPRADRGAWLSSSLLCAAFALAAPAALVEWSGLKEAAVRPEQVQVLLRCVFEALQCSLSLTAALLLGLAAALLAARALRAKRAPKAAQYP